MYKNLKLILSSFFIDILTYITNTKCMTIFLLLISSLIILLCVNMLINTEIKYNLSVNLGEFKIKIFKVLLFKGSFSIKQNLIEIKGKDKLVKINLKFTKKQLRFIKQLQKNIKTKIYLDYINLESLICLEDAFMCSILSGTLQLISNIFFCNVKANNYDAIIYNHINSGFRHNLISIKLKLNIYASIFDILWAVIVTLISSRRIENEKRRAKTEY